MIVATAVTVQTIILIVLSSIRHQYVLANPTNISGITQKPTYA